MRKQDIKAFFVVAGMLVGFLFVGYSWATTVSNIPPLMDWQWGIGLGLLIMCISMFSLVYRIYGNFLWSEPDLSYMPQSEDKYLNDNFYKSALLEIFNHEELEITKCFATLEFANDISVDENSHVSIIPLIPSLAKKSERIKWEQEQGAGENCEIVIPVHGRKRINIASLLGTLRYHLEEGDFGTQWTTHTVKIRIDGYFNNKAMKPLYFDGYIYATNLENAEEAFSKNGKIRSNNEIVLSQIKNLVMIFREGTG